MGIKPLYVHPARDVPPQSVADRIASPYPSTPHLGYVTELRRPAAAEPGSAARAGIERALDLHTWIEEYHPEISV